MEKSDGVPAWLKCEDMLTRAKDELILEAIDLLKLEMKEKRIDIKGYIAALPDKGQELEQDLFMIGQLIARVEEIRSQYSGYLEKERNGEITDPEVIARGEALRRFLMSIDAIDMLMHFSRVFGTWADDTGVYSALKDPVDVMVKSASLDGGRADALDFVLSSKKFSESDALSNDEMQVLEETLDRVDRKHEGHTHGHE
jgi:hypothetical protein